MAKGKRTAHVLPIIGAACTSLLIVLLAFAFNLKSPQGAQDVPTVEDALIEIEPDAIPLSKFEGPSTLPVEESDGSETDVPENEFDGGAESSHDDAMSAQNSEESPSSQSEGNASLAVPQAQLPGTVRILDRDIPYAYTYGITYAPDEGCGIWKGVASVDDGGYAFFVGHNPGDFANIMELSIGDAVTVCDDEGKSRQYTVQDAFVLPQRTTFQDIEERVTGHGESVVLQTCCGDNVNIRVVVAW